ncbi:MAG TPA: DEAD/DEAH box helicase [Polyangiaceae bacterium]|nr:DEAD/DEAH box helicase [Polyangiaceae bacterium]
MTEPTLASELEPAFASAFARKGYEELTPVQAKVLDPALAGRDLRVTSQTGSGKTIAIGLAIRYEVIEPAITKKGTARPRALVVAPTRELARQMEEELTWLYEDVGARVASTTGGTSFRDEVRALSASPVVVVGTPGRLLDHLTRKSIDTSEVGAIVLDEADRMLDLGFREELEAIFDHLPEEHRTHLVSATFPSDVRALADRVQQNAAHVEGTRLGSANTDIDHVIHVVHPREKLGALVNLLLANPDAQTLIFARTRADVADIAAELDRAGFRVGSLSGELDQAARNRALAAFKRGDMQALVATDVAARGIDVQDIARVIHLDVPTNADSYTHRSGRTGRAGRRGISALLVPPSGMRQAQRVLSHARVAHKIEPIPTADVIRRAADDRVFTELTQPEEADTKPNERVRALAERLVAAGDVNRTVERLLLRTRGPEGAEPRDLSDVTSREPKHGERRPNERRPSAERFEHQESRGPRQHAPRSDREEDWVRFRVTWGHVHGADSRRLLAMVCRRGGIEGRSVGAIWVDKMYSIVSVAADLAAEFTERTGKPDPRDPRVRIEPYRESPPGRQGPPPGRQGPREHTPAREHTPRPREHAPARDQTTPREHAPAREHTPAREHAPRPRIEHVVPRARPTPKVKGSRGKRRDP